MATKKILQLLILKSLLHPAAAIIKRAEIVITIRADSEQSLRFIDISRLRLA
jgi:hypothetical protein